MAYEFESLLAESSKIHGHLCPGQVLGVRMAIAGLEKIGVIDPRGRDRKNIIVFVEMDRCAADAIQSVTGCSLGHRTMKFLDYGKMAASFLNLKTGKAARIVAREDARGRASECLSGHEKYAAQIKAYKVMTQEELFDLEDVNVELDPHDMPGRPLSRVRCDACGEYVQDGREIRKKEKTLCKACAFGAYYNCNDNPTDSSFFMNSVMHNSHNDMQIRSKIWVEADGEPVFGKGRRLLLEAIDRHGSINQAARMVNISYKKAWSHIKAMEERLGIRLVECRTGGKSGGGGTLTHEAREFLKMYKELERGINEFVDRRFNIIFKE